MINLIHFLLARTQLFEVIKELFACIGRIIKFCLQGSAFPLLIKFLVATMRGLEHDFIKAGDNGKASVIIVLRCDFMPFNYGLLLFEESVDFLANGWKGLLRSSRGLGEKQDANKKRSKDLPEINCRTLFI